MANLYFFEDSMENIHAINYKPNAQIEDQSNDLDLDPFADINSLINELTNSSLI